MSESIDPTEWNRVCGVVRDAMAKMIFPLTTPIAYAPPETTLASLEGTGTYVILGTNCYLLTNDHVLEAGESGIAHLPGPTDDYHAVVSNWKKAQWPVDVALARVPEATLERLENSVLAGEFDPAFDPVENELLFWIGYPGTDATRRQPVGEKNRIRNWFGGPLDARAVPVLSQHQAIDGTGLLEFSIDHHVAVPYPARAWRSADAPQNDVPNAKGMSGSLLWDTKFVACNHRGIPWQPTMAKVCGLLVSAHDKPEVVYVIRIEFVRERLLHFVREEDAYGSWLRRGAPVGHPDVDWWPAVAKYPTFDSLLPQL